MLEVHYDPKVHLSYILRIFSVIVWVMRLFFMGKSRDPLTIVCKIWTVSEILNAPKHNKTKRAWEALAQTHCGSVPSGHPPTLLTHRVKGYREKGMSKIPSMHFLKGHRIWV